MPRPQIDCSKIFLVARGQTNEVGLPMAARARRTAELCRHKLMRNEVTVLILTFNEAPNIGRALERLSWAKEILIIDSGSTDGTLISAQAAHPNVKVVTRPFDSFAGQCNFGLERITTEWVLSMDADYILSPEFISELARLDPAAVGAGYW